MNRTPAVNIKKCAMFVLPCKLHVRKDEAVTNSKLNVRIQKFCKGAVQSFCEPVHIVRIKDYGITFAIAAFTAAFAVVAAYCKFIINIIEFSVGNIL